MNLGRVVFLLVLLFVLLLPLLLDTKLWLFSFFPTAFIFFASTHNYFSFRIHDSLLNRTLLVQAHLHFNRQ